MKLSLLDFLIIFFIIVIVIEIIIVYTTGYERTTTIKAKDSLGGRVGKYRVTMVDGSVYSVKNSLWIWHFTSAEVYGILEEGKTYIIKGYGIRIPALGMFPNITSARLA